MKLIQRFMRPLVLAGFLLLSVGSVLAVDIVITATSTVRVSGNVAAFSLGETVTAGQPLYVSTSDGLAYKSDANAAGKKECVGIALNGGAINQPVRVQSTGTITIGGTTVVGTIYCVSATAGGICPWADLTTGDQVIVIGVGGATNTIDMNLWQTNQAKP